MKVGGPLPAHSDLNPTPFSPLSVHFSLFCRHKGSARSQEGARGRCAAARGKRPGRVRGPRGHSAAGRVCGRAPPVPATPPPRRPHVQPVQGALPSRLPQERLRPGRARSLPAPHCSTRASGLGVGLSPPQAPLGVKREDGLAQEPAGFLQFPGSLAVPLTTARRLRLLQTPIQPGSSPVARGPCPGEGGGAPPRGCPALKRITQGNI